MAGQGRALKLAGTLAHFPAPADYPDSPDSHKYLVGLLLPLSSPSSSSCSSSSSSSFFLPFLCLSVFVLAARTLGNPLYPQELLIVLEAFALYPPPVLLL